MACENSLEQSIRALVSEENLGLEETRNHFVKSWSQISSKFKDVNPHHRQFLRDYFRAQLRFAQGKTTKGRRIMEGLVKRVGYEEFEENNLPLLASIDLFVKGETRLWDVEPAWDVGPTRVVFYQSGVGKRIRVKP